MLGRVWTWHKLNVVLLNSCVNWSCDNYPRSHESCKSKRLPELGRENVINPQSWTKVLGTVLQYSYVSVTSVFPLTVNTFRKFLAAPPPPPPHPTPNTKLKLTSNIGVRGGVGPVRIGKPSRNAKVSQDRWLSKKEVRRKKAILRGFQAWKSVFRASDERSQVNKPFPIFSKFFECVWRIRSKRMIYTRNCGIS